MSETEGKVENPADSGLDAAAPFETEDAEKTPENIEARAEQEIWQHEAMYIKGSAVFAKILGRGEKHVRDVDVFLARRSETKRSTIVREYKSTQELQGVLPEDEFKKLAKWVSDNGYSDKKINLVGVDEQELAIHDVFVNEPRVLLYDKTYEKLTELAESLKQGARDEGEFNRLLIRRAGDFMRRSSMAQRRLAGLRIRGEAGLQRALHSYKSGNLIEGGMPMSLYPNGSLAKALRIADLGERFGISYDKTHLDLAEREARNDTLKLSPSEVVAGDTEGAGYDLKIENRPLYALDQAALKIGTEKVRKYLARNYPRLLQIMERVESVGGISKYIEEEFGKAYIVRGKPVALTDIKLSKSPASLEEQLEFLAELDKHIKERLFFPLLDVRRTDQAVVLPPIPDNYINKGLLAEAEKYRGTASHTKGLEPAFGNYEVDVDKMGVSPSFKQKIDALLKVMHLDWPDEVFERSDQNLTKQLKKLGVHPRHPLLQEVDQTQKHKINLLISGESNAILQASFKKPWESCVNLEDGSYRDGLYEDIRNGSAVAYLMRQDKFIGRVLVRLCITSDGEVAAGVDKYYGDQRYRMVAEAAVKKVFGEAGIKTDTEAITMEPFHNAYIDFGLRDREGKIIYNYDPKVKFRLFGGGRAIIDTPYP